MPIRKLRVLVAFESNRGEPQVLVVAYLEAGRLQDGARLRPARGGALVGLGLRVAQPEGDVLRAVLDLHRGSQVKRQ